MFVKTRSGRVLVLLLCLLVLTEVIVEGDKVKDPGDGSDLHKSGYDAREKCKAALDPGPCKEAIPRWYFDLKDGPVGQCKTYNYGGCDGSVNNFRDKDTCSNVCNPPPTTPQITNPDEINSQDACLKRKEAGPCTGNVTLWHWKRKRCESFQYGGCLGNANRFLSEADCNTRCLSSRMGSEPA